jgi:hypothetical protein
VFQYKKFSARRFVRPSQNPNSNDDDGNSRSSSNDLAMQQRMENWAALGQIPLTKPVDKPGNSSLHEVENQLHNFGNYFCF